MGKQVDIEIKEHLGTIDVSDITYPKIKLSDVEKFRRLVMSTREVKERYYKVRSKKNKEIEVVTRKKK